MNIARRRATDHPGCRVAAHDRGAVDVSIQMLFGFMLVLLVMLLIFETTTYWHARNVLDDAAAEGARVAAAFDGSCAAGVAVAQDLVLRTAGTWADGVSVSCADGPMVTVTVTGRTPGVFGSALGMHAQATETAPKEG